MLVLPLSTEKPAVLVLNSFNFFCVFVFPPGLGSMKKGLLQTQVAPDRLAGRRAEELRQPIARIVVTNFWSFPLNTAWIGCKNKEEEPRAHTGWRRAALRGRLVGAELDAVLQRHKSQTEGTAGYCTPERPITVPYKEQIILPRRGGTSRVQRFHFSVLSENETAQWITTGRDI